MTALFTYIKHVREELGHVEWPSNREAIAHTLMIILVSAIVALLVGVLDYVFGLAVSSVVSGY